MSALPRPFYGDPFAVLARERVAVEHRAQGCSACAWFDFSPADGQPCRKRLNPGRHWCRGFEERAT